MRSAPPSSSPSPPPRGPRLAAGLAALLLAGGCSEAPPSWQLAQDGLEGAVLGVWAPAGSAEAFFVGQRGLLLRWDGGRWERFPVPSQLTLWWTFGTSPQDVWAGGERGLLLHYDGARWERVATGLDDEATIFGIWGTGSDDLWVVGGHLRTRGPGFALRGGRRGFTPQTLPAAPERDLFKVWGSAADDVWIVGDEGALLHFDGRQFTRRQLVRPGLGGRRPDRLVTVAGRGRDDVWIVGGDDRGVVFHFDGAGWRGEEVADTLPLAGVHTAPGEAVRLVGLLGQVRRRDGERWVSEAIGRPTDFHAVVGLGGGRAFAVGGNLLGLGPPRGTIFFRGAAPFPAAPVPPPVAVDGGLDSATAPADLGEGPRPDGGLDLAGPGDLPAPDAGLPDLGPAVEQGVPDLGPGDLAAITDLTVAERGLGPGAPCPSQGGCAPGLECWFIMASGIFVCTEPCTDPAECKGYGPSPQCAAPGCQALFLRRCLPRELVGCGALPRDQ